MYTYVQQIKNKLMIIYCRNNFYLLIGRKDDSNINSAKNLKHLRHSKAQGKKEKKIYVIDVTAGRTDLDIAFISRALTTWSSKYLDKFSVLRYFNFSKLSFEPDYLV